MTKKIILLDDFYKINSNKILKDLFLLIFPELKNIGRINNLENSSKEILKSKNFAKFLKENTIKKRFYVKNRLINFLI